MKTTAGELTSIIVPTRNKRALLEVLVATLVRSLEASGERAELIIADNGSDEPDALAWLAALPEHPSVSSLESVRVLSLPGPFNYSHLNNTAAQYASGNLLCFLNNDIEIINTDWLTVMARLAIRKSSGCVGACLLYPDDTIQHAGVVVGVETIAGHIYKHAPAEASGHAGYLNKLQQVDAVTGACLVMRRSVFKSLDGFDEALPVAFNDVDLCLRALEAGYENLWTPDARLRHHESKSRGTRGNRSWKQKWIHRKAIRHMRARWPQALKGNPHSLHQWQDAVTWQSTLSRSGPDPIAR